MVAATAELARWFDYEARRGALDPVIARDQIAEVKKALADQKANRPLGIPERH